MADMPDLSHLTEEERKIIEKVMLRQKQEEERENEIMRRKQDEVQILEETIRQRSEQQRKAGIELDATCHICLKTKFADGIGHICNYCNTRCCARCGGKVTLRSNKVIWVCIVCRKKQELLSKTGQWINKGLGPQDTIMSKIQADLNQHQFPTADESLRAQADKRPKLERAHSACEKENLPLQRTNSQLRRQYSQQEQSTRTVENVQPQYQGYNQYPEDRSFYRAELDNLMRSAPYFNKAKTDTDFVNDLMGGQYEKSNVYPEVVGVHSTKMDTSVGDGFMDSKMHKRTGSVKARLQLQRSFSSSEDEENRSTPNTSLEDMKMAGTKDPTSIQGSSRQLVQQYHRRSHERQLPETPKLGSRLGSSFEESRLQEERPVAAARMGPNYAGNRHSTENIYTEEKYEEGVCSTSGERRHSISSDYPQSEFGHRGEKLEREERREVMDRNTLKQTWYEMIRNRYQSAGRGKRSDIQFPKTLENFRSKYFEMKNTIVRSGSKMFEEADKRMMTERRKKIVRFDKAQSSSGSFEGDWMTLTNMDTWDEMRQGSQDSGTKDSGIETGSNFTSSEDSNRGDIKHPPTWEMNEDGTQLIGHMILNRIKEPMTGNAAILGLKVEGDRLLPNGKRGALIDKVKMGSIADVEGQLRPGDEVVEWNGQHFRGLSDEEVARVIDDSRLDVQVELLICRYVGQKRQGGPFTWNQGQVPALPRRPILSSVPVPLHSDFDKRLIEKPSLRVTSPGSPDVHSARPCRIKHALATNANVGGKLQVKLWFDPITLQLVLTLVCATGLTSRSNGDARNPYVKVVLLPDRSDKSKRRTKTIAASNEPRWNETFIFVGIRKADLKLRVLDITVWDYIRFGTNDFLGEVTLEVATTPINDEAIWYPLGAHKESVPIYGRRDEMELDLSPTDHLSPPSTISRFSDSDASDFEDMARDRRYADGASISSVGSSISPPIDLDLTERRSRRDMSPQGRKRTAVMISRDDQLYRRDGQSYISPRSHSAAPTDSPSFQYRSRSKSPGRGGSVSPPDCGRIYPSYVPRFASRSATVTPTGSPKKRHLPQIPSSSRRNWDIYSHDFDDRAQVLKQRVAPMQRKYSTGGWERYGNRNGFHRNEGMTLDVNSRTREWLSPERVFRDSDMESVGSVTSSNLSNPSDRMGACGGVNDFASPLSGTGICNLDPSATQRSQHERMIQSKELVLDKLDLGSPSAARRNNFGRSLSNAEPLPSETKKDGSLSDTAVAASPHVDRKDGGKSSDRGGKILPQSLFPGLGKKSNSTSQISATGRKRRLGFGKSGRTSFTVHRSEEVLPEDARRLAKQGSSVSSDGEGPDGESCWVPPFLVLESDHLARFIDGLGPGQVVGRQVLGAPSLGDIQLGICLKQGTLEVEVIRARGLKQKPGSKLEPAAYTKVYLVNPIKKTVAKAKTSTARRTLAPLFQEILVFKSHPAGCILQVTVWGDYGRLEGKKVFMGLAQIMLEDLDLTNVVIGWYKLFGTGSLVSGPLTLGLCRRSSLASFESD